MLALDVTSHLVIRDKQVSQREVDPPVEFDGYLSIDCRQACLLERSPVHDNGTG